MASQTLPKLPIIDLTKGDLTPGTSQWRSSCNDVRHALEDYGCFVAVYDKVSSELNDKVFAAMKELFDLPTETKILNTLDIPNAGYVGQIARIPCHESMGIAEATSLEGVRSFTNLMWPSGNDQFCESMLSFSTLVLQLKEMVVKMVFESYGVEKYYDSHAKSSTYLLRPLRYKIPQPNESNIGADIHTDKTFMTIIRQDQVSGLKVQSRNGDWIPVDFQPQSFIVMAGDAFLAWSNDRIHSVRHQVILTENKTRYSIGLFAYNTGITNIPEELVDDNHPLQFKPFDNFELHNFYFRGTPKSHPTKCTAKAYCGIHA